MSSANRDNVSSPACKNEFLDGAGNQPATVSIHKMLTPDGRGAIKLSFRPEPTDQAGSMLTLPGPRPEIEDHGDPALPELSPLPISWPRLREREDEGKNTPP